MDHRMETATVLAGIAGVHVLAVASPGPTFAVMMRYAAARDRRAGLFLTLGVVLASLVWACAIAVGLGGAMAQVPVVYRILRVAGAIYLIYLGIKSLIAFRKGKMEAVAYHPVHAKGRQALAAGFITNITNPKVVAYYTSLFGAFIPASGPHWLFWAAVVIVVAVSALWWTSVTLFFAIPAVHAGFIRMRHRLDLVMGLLLVALGLMLLLD
jgi:threonine efflux protein